MSKRAELESARVDFDGKLDAFSTSVDAKVAERFKVKGKYQKGSGVVSTDLVGKGWKVGYDFSKKTLHGQYEHKFEAFDFRVRQRVPDFNWSVIPSPELEVETKLVDGSDVSDSLELKYDMSKRLASVEEKVKIGKKHECVVSLDSAGGLDGMTVHWKTKVGSQYAKNVGAKYSRKKGPVVSYGVDPTEQVAVKLEAALSPQVIKGELVFKPEQQKNAEVGVNFQRHINSAEKPWMGFFVKWKFS